jgi:hypothetical protein
VLYFYSRSYPCSYPRSRSHSYSYSHFFCINLESPPLLLHTLSFTACYRALLRHYVYTAQSSALSAGKRYYYTPWRAHSERVPPAFPSVHQTTIHTTGTMVPRKYYPVYAKYEAPLDTNTEYYCRPLKRFL